ncbi:hypothetical protein CFP56_038681, partial [Quercus suber]
ETQRPIFHFPPRNHPFPFLPVLFLLLRLAQNPPRPEQPTRPGSATQAPCPQPRAPYLLPILHLQPGIPVPHDPLPPRASPGHASVDLHRHSTGRPEVVARCLERPKFGWLSDLEFLFFYFFCETEKFVWLPRICIKIS